MPLHSISSTRKTLGLKAYEMLRKEIISLHMQPGEMIYENKVSELLGVSRTPVREAFNLLQQEELIDILPQRGAQVAFMSEQKINEAQYIRESLELCTFREVAKRWDAEHPECITIGNKIEQILQSQEQAVQAHDYIQFVMLDNAYHETILGALGNRTLLLMINQVRAHLHRMRYLELQEIRHEKGAIVQHRGILEAIKRNDVDQTEQLLTAHLKNLDDIRPTIIQKHAHLFKGL